jgi:hypothetical protein
MRVRQLAVRHGSVEADVGSLDHLAVACQVAAHLFGELLGRSRTGVDAHGQQLVLDHRVIEHRLQLGVQALQHGSRGAGRGQHGGLEQAQSKGGRGAQAAGQPGAAGMERRS